MAPRDFQELLDAGAGLCHRSGRSRPRQQSPAAKPPGHGQRPRAARRAPATSYNLGVLYEGQGDVGRVWHCYEEARGKGVVSATLNLGVLYHGRGDVGRARQCYEEARGKGDVDAAFNLGVLHEMQGDARAAREVWEDARGKGHAMATLYLGSLREKQGDVRGAWELYEEARELHEEARSKGEVRGSPF